MNVFKKLLSFGLCVGLLGAAAQAECGWKGWLASSASLFGVSFASSKLQEFTDKKIQKWNGFVDSCAVFYNKNQDLIQVGKKDKGAAVGNCCRLRKALTSYREDLTIESFGKDKLALNIRDAMENAIVRGAVCIPATAKNIDIIPGLSKGENGEGTLVNVNSFEQVNFKDNSVKMYKPISVKGYRQESGNKVLRELGEQVDKQRKRRSFCKIAQAVSLVGGVSAIAYPLLRKLF